jgi:hypothetical protein
MRDADRDQLGEDVDGGLARLLACLEEWLEGIDFDLADATEGLDDAGRLVLHLRAQSRTQHFGRSDAMSFAPSSP